MTQEQYEQIERLGKLQFSEADVCIICDFDEKVYFADPLAHRAYLRGSLRAQAEVREKNYEQAKQGVPSSQKIFFDSVEKLNRQNDDF